MAVDVLPNVSWVKMSGPHEAIHPGLSARMLSPGDASFGIHRCAGWWSAAPCPGAGFSIVNAGDRLPGGAV